MSTTVLLTLLVVAAIGVFAFRRAKRGTAESAERSDDSRAMNIPADSRSAFIVCVFSMLGKLASADGHVSPEEAAKVEDYMDFHLKLDRKTRSLALRVFRESVNSPLELRDYAEKFRQTHRERYRMFDAMIEILVELSAADGVLSSREDELIGSAALVLGLTEPAYEGIKAKHVRGEHLSH